MNRDKDKTIITCQQRIQLGKINSAQTEATIYFQGSGTFSRPNPYRGTNGAEGQMSLLA